MTTASTTPCCHCQHEPLNLTERQIVEILQYARRLWIDGTQSGTKLYRKTDLLTAIKASVAILHEPQHWADAIRQVTEALVHLKRESLYSITEQFKAKLARKSG